MPRSSFIALVLAVASSTASAASLQDGIQAYQHLDFAAAMQILQPYATAGDPKAQRIVGEMYLRGQGVPLSSFVAAYAIYYAVRREGNRWIAILEELAFLSSNTIYHIAPLFRLPRSRGVGGIFDAFGIGCGQLTVGCR